MTLVGTVLSPSKNKMFNILERYERFFLLSIGKKIEYGTLKIYFPGKVNCEVFVGKYPGPTGVMRIRKPGVSRKILLGGSIGFAQSYLDDYWDSDNLTDLLHLGALNMSVLHNDSRVSLILGIVNKTKHWLSSNTRRGSKKNISFHYDLGNDFYQLWLDREMAYSSALFDGDDISIEEAQNRKFYKLLELLEVSPKDKLLEIGSGWGGLSLYIARQVNCDVTAVTISEEQLIESLRRRDTSDVKEKVNFKLQDYRDIKGTFDRIVSVEMIEAVGETYWKLYFEKISKLLSPGGKVVLQAITINDSVFTEYRSRVDFIQRYIFPGGMLPSRGRLIELAAEYGFQWVSDSSYAEDYAKTLKIWRSRFDSKIPKIRAMGFDEVFCRTWQYYLSYCEAGFLTKRTNLRHIVLTK